MITEAHGIPLAVSLTGGNRNDVTQLMPLIEAIPPVRGRRGRPRQRPGAIYADRGYDHDKYRKQVRDKGITRVIARRSTEHGSGLGTYRWVIEQSIALLHWFRRLRIRWEIRDDIHEAFLSLACAIICWRRLTKLSFWSESRTLAGRAAAAGGEPSALGGERGLAVGCLEFSGGGVDGFEGDLVAAALDGADVVADLAADAGAAFVVVGAEVGVDGLRV